MTADSTGRGYPRPAVVLPRIYMAGGWWRVRGNEQGRRPDNIHNWRWNAAVMWTVDMNRKKIRCAQ